MPHPIYAQIGARIKARRQQLDRLKQEALAVRLGISRGSLANIETGRQGILVHQLYRFAEALEMSPSDLLPDVLPPMDNTPSRGELIQKLPAGLKAAQQQQIMQLIENTPASPTTPKKVQNAKQSKR